jgi:hypothetical protein
MFELTLQRRDVMEITSGSNFIIVIIIFHHEFWPGWPISVSAIMWSNSLLSGRGLLTLTHLHTASP